MCIHRTTPEQPSEGIAYSLSLSIDYAKILQESSRGDASRPVSQNFEKSFLPASYVDYWLGYMQGPQ